MNIHDLAKLKNMYPKGTKIVLDYMDDIQSPPIGTIGTIVGIDDIGSLMVVWENGSNLNIIPFVDKFHKYNE